MRMSERTITQERRVVKHDTLHKWVATSAAIVAIAWGGLAYYVKAEDNQTRLDLQGQINILKTQQEVDIRINELVMTIDKQLSRIESQLAAQNSLVVEVRQLRSEVNDLKLQLAKKHG